ncbi:MAG: hypothetical protein JW718_04300, partial [Desulfovibrionaceae bacterium]|nr:hypothetical protein [Desulfovibrionaceae bacterium]
MRMLEYLKGLFSSLARVMTPKSRPRAPKPETKAPAAGARLKNKGPEARPGDRSGDRAGQDKGPKKKLKKKVGPQAAATQAGPKGPEKQAPEPGATGQPGPAQAQPQP